MALPFHMSISEYGEKIFSKIADTLQLVDPAITVPAIDVQSMDENTCVISLVMHISPSKGDLDE
uniref:Uncharacterized protein n=1 Tax=Leviviridae sp. TaxID=2027243 RepID=A0A514D8R3_9VIRU|nr:MAG: hypothetical protein H1RhizoL1215e3415_000003 [Leviviridae sp.]